MRKLLWIGDAGCQSGFAKATHYTLEELRKTWDVAVLGINYRGDPHSWPYPIYPAGVNGDAFGIRRLNELMPKIAPDLVVIQNDPWNLPKYMTKLASWPIVAALAVDGKNCRARDLNGLTLAIFWTQFGYQEARLGGYAGPAAVIPLGVDLDIYKPVDQLEARRRMRLPKRFQNSFIVGNVNRNQPRKRLDLCISYFAEWIRTRGVEDAFLFLHVAPTGDEGYDCQQLAAYYGIGSRLILVEPEVFHGEPEDKMPYVYGCFDIMATTAQGEGWGLPALEGMACGIPQVLPDWAAYGEWAKDAAAMIPCTTTIATPHNINAIGGIADKTIFIDTLDELYRNKAKRNELKELGFKKAHSPEYRWPTIGQQFAHVIDEALKLPLVLKKSEELQHA